MFRIVRDWFGWNDIFFDSSGFREISFEERVALIVSFPLFVRVISGVSVEKKNPGFIESIFV